MLPFCVLGFSGLGRLADCFLVCILDLWVGLGLVSVGCCLIIDLLVIGCWVVLGLWIFGFGL